MKRIQKEVLICECSSQDHTYSFWYDDEENSIYFQPRLVNYKNPIQRLKRAVGYVFNIGKRKGKTYHFGDYDSMLIHPEDCKKLINILNKCDKKHNHPFYLVNFALYTKFHYKRSENIWEDVKKCLQADGYTPENNEDILGIIQSNILDLVKESQYRYFFNDYNHGIQEKNCWKYGYYTEGNNWMGRTEPLPKYDQQTAILHWFKSYLSNVLVENLGWDLKNPPKANKKVLPLTKKNK